MSTTAEFRLLSDEHDLLAEVVSVIYRDVKQFGKVSVLTSDDTLLERISECLWRNSKDEFVTYQFAKDGVTATVNVLLSNELRHIKNTPALCIIDYLLEPANLRFRQITEIVSPTPETVDKARRQYKMYRSAGLQVSHLER